MNISKETLAQALMLVNDAVKHDPHELYHAAGEPAMDGVFRSVARRLCYEAVRDNKLAADEVSEPRSFLYHAMADTAKILHNPWNADTARLPQVARHSETIRSIATLALRDESQMRGLLEHPLRYGYYGYEQGEDYIEVNPRLHIPESGGCPFAHKGDRSPNPTPIFAKVIALTGDLIAITHEHTAK